jgi:hypothetical protein
MTKQLIGIALATVAIFMWGFVYWGLLSAPYAPLKATNGDEAAGQALLEHFPATGMYLIPGAYNDPEDVARMFAEGPIAMVNFVREGHPMEDPVMMGQGFVLNLVVVFLLSVVIKKALPTLPSYNDRVLFAALLGLTAVVMINLGDAVWWRYPWSWKLSQALYGFISFCIAGAVLGKFIKPEKAA